MMLELRDQAAIVGMVPIEYGFNPLTMVKQRR